MMRFGLVDNVVAKLLLWRQIAAQREELGRASVELLKDIGISRAEAVHEAHRHFWDTESLERKREQVSAPPELTLRYH